MACRITNAGLTPITIARGTQIGFAHPLDHDGLAIKTESVKNVVGAICAAMTRTSQFQERQQLELNREAYGDVSTRAKLRD